MKKDFLTLQDITRDDLEKIFELSAKLKKNAVIKVSNRSPEKV